MIEMFEMTEEEQEVSRIAKALYQEFTILFLILLMLL